MTESNYDEAVKWLEKQYTEAFNQESKSDMLLIEWILDKLYFDNDMRNS